MTTHHTRRPPLLTTRLPAGHFTLHPAHPDTHTPLLHTWGHDPDTAPHWPELHQPPHAVRAHLEQLLAPHSHSTPCIGHFDDTPMSYWELYRADLDPLARHYPARPHDAGLHLLLGPPHYRGRGLGPQLIRAVSDHQLATDPRTTRVLAEPDTRNTRSIHAFRRAGFHPAGELDLPDKKALLMIRDRPESAHRSATPHFQRTVNSPSPNA
ncbi:MULTISPECIES: GNAT family N-acetyltransferase [Streptomyces]|uniref:N-acetyltransferase n=2 Tax=Streptomyces TaxID=1883 RepID=A0A3M8FD21_9ACTN|nr:MULTISPECIES: GNAT family N-acetyltransferase [Streptomyces]KNE83579.1 hypothetical protein ADZ36_04340 [Streptomyces fradiae]OFA53264.1 hypothetical protein BEN35_09680 [Streptomyces fradiae]PQM25203.1 N-acetyltransferase [Streptomyces xinghaiensis]RKM99255.1 N-acetyltransferase [Streptomyces xinghaiensis]RNC75841.1 N-acetyltransferase [Streptomyces xinghaiensis]